MGPSFIEAGRMRQLRDELADLKAKVDFQERVLEMQSYRIAQLEHDNKAVMTSHSVKEFIAADAYRKAIEIVENMKGDFWTRSIPNDVAKQWVNATIEDIVRALEHRLKRCEGKL